MVSGPAGLLISGGAVIAGDGTARAGAEMAGPKGPLVAPLPGGTMNMLPNALYGGRDWKTAMADILSDGVERNISGGEIDGRAFYVAAILGSPALWAEARARFGKGGPYLFGTFSAADIIYAPVVSRFITYGVAVPGFAVAYMEAIWTHEWMQSWIEAAEAEEWVIEQWEAPKLAK
mgnify:CR=1 FL=1